MHQIAFYQKTMIAFANGFKPAPEEPEIPKWRQQVGTPNPKQVTKALHTKFSATFQRLIVTAGLHGKPLKCEMTEEDGGFIAHCEISAIEEPEDPEAVFQDCIEMYSSEIESVRQWMRDPYSNGFGTTILPDDFVIDRLPNNWEEYYNMEYLTVRFPNTNVKARVYLDDVQLVNSEVV